MDTGKTNKFKEEMIKTARAICAPGKGILAADQNTPTVTKYFDFEGYKFENNEENRRRYRELLFTAPGIEKFVSAVILYEETFYQKSSDGVFFRDLLHSRGIIPGIKADIGFIPMNEAGE